MKLINRILCMLLCFVMLAVFLIGCGTDKAEETQQRIPVIVPRQNYLELPYVDYSLSDLPEFVENLSQCVDQEKQYVLPDGYIYEYRKTFVPDAINQLHVATDADGYLFHDCGYQDNVRIRSVLEIGATDYSFVTGFIPVKPGDVLYFSGNCLDPQYENSLVMHTVLYDANRKVVAHTSMQEIADTYFEVLETNEAGYVMSLRVNQEVAPDDLAFIRFTLIGSGAMQIISINESLEKGQETLAWVQTEKYIPAGWRKEIADTIQTVNDIELSDPDAAIRFVFATDIHVDPDPDTSYTNYLGRVCAEVMQACEIPLFATGGDNCTQSTGFMPSDFGENMDVLLKQLEPIPQKNILLSVGNHDGATGAREVNGETLYYRYQLNNEQRSAIFFDWQRESNEYKHFDSDGTYYYLDDSATKTRYIILNSFWSRWEGNEDGFVPDVQNSFFHVPMFGEQQLMWFASEALDMPPDYGAIIITHFAPDAKDFEVFKGIVDAFSNRTRYEGSYVGEEDWQSTDIAVNYKYANGEIIAVFQGHNHEDAQHDFFQKVPCINVTTAGAHWAARGDTALERVKGTASEFAVDVVLIDRENRIIYLTRLGAGEDREISY